MMAALHFRLIFLNLQIVKRKARKPPFSSGLALPMIEQVASCLSGT